MPAPTLGNVLVGFAWLYTAPKGTAKPADTVAYGTSWPNPWTYIGATEEGLTLAVGTDTGEIRIEEQSLPVKRVVNAKTFELRFALAEDTVASMKLAYGGGTITAVAGTTGVAAKQRLTLSDTLDELAVGFDGISPFGFTRRVVVPSVISTGDVETAYRRAANNRAYPTVLSAICAPSDIVVDDWSAIPA